MHPGLVASPQVEQLSNVRVFRQWEETREPGQKIHREEDRTQNLFSITA